MIKIILPYRKRTKKYFRHNILHRSIIRKK